MRRIEVGQAISAGFRLIGREPMAFLAWCGVCFVVSAVPQAFIVGSAIPFYKAIAAAGVNAGDPTMLQAENDMMRLQPLSYLSALVLVILLPAAIFRAVLEPEARRRFYLRLGAAEGWTVAVTLVLIVMWIIGAVLSMLPVFIVSLVAAAAGGGASGGAAATMLFLIPAFGVLIWATLRLSMAPVMAFAGKTFRLTESWKFTRSHAWRMFLVGLALMAIFLLAELLLMGIGLGAFVGGGGLAKLQSGGLLSSLGPPHGVGWLWVGLAMAAYSALIAANNVIWMAAWADMYAQLRPPLAAVFD